MEDIPIPGEAQRMRLGVVGIAAVVCAGCSFATLQTARPIEAGKAQISPQIAFQAFSTNRYPTIDYGYSSFPIPQGDLAFRGGLTRYLEIGGVIGTSGAELGAKVLCTPADWSQFAIGFAPSVRGRAILRGNVKDPGGLQTIGIADVMLPLLFEWDPHERVAVVAGFKGIVTANSTYAIPSPIVHFGGSLGAGFWFTQRFGMLVEGGAYRPVNVSGNAPTLFEGGIAFRFRVGRRSPEVPPDPEPEPERERETPEVQPPPPEPVAPLTPFEPTPFPTPVPPPPAWVDPAGSATTGALSITVVDRQTGAPLAQANVKLGGWSSTTDAQGRSAFSNLTPGPLGITVALDRYLPTEEAATVVAGRNSPVEVRLVAAKTRVPGTIKGLVRSSATGKAVAAAVELPQAKLKTTTNSAGVFALQVKGATYTVIISARGYLSQQTTINVTDGDQVILNVDLHPQ